MMRSKRGGPSHREPPLFSQLLQQLAMLLAHVVLLWQISIITHRCEQQLCARDHAIQETS